MTQTYVFDTTGLYGLDPLFKGRKHLSQFESRSREILGYFIEAYLDNDAEFKLIIPDIEERLKKGRPLPLLAPSLWNKDSSDIIAPANLSLDPENLKLLFNTHFQNQLDGAEDVIKRIAEFHLHPDICKGHKDVTGEPDAIPGVPKTVAKAVEEEFRRLDDKCSEPDARLIKAAFGFYQRGASYGATAKENNGKYMTHPYRWSACGTWERKQGSGIEASYLSAVLVHLQPDEGFETPEVLLKGLDKLRNKSIRTRFSERLKDVVLAIKKEGDSETVRRLMKKLQADSWWFAREWARPSLKDEEIETVLRAGISGVIALTIASTTSILQNEPQFLNFLPDLHLGWNLPAKGGVATGAFWSVNKLISKTGIGLKPGTNLTLPKWVGDVVRNHVQIELPLPESVKQSCPFCGAPHRNDTCSICFK